MKEIPVYNKKKINRHRYCIQKAHRFLRKSRSFTSLNIIGVKKKQCNVKIVRFSESILH
jgi:hypothetical protein